MADAIFGYLSSEVHVGVGLWDGSTRLAFAETMLAAAYTAVVTFPDVAGTGDAPLSLDWDRAVSPVDQRLTVAVVVRANVGGAALVGSAIARAEVATRGVQVQLALD